MDGPFYPNRDLPVKEAKAALREEAYTAMKKRAELSDTEYIRYIRAEEAVPTTPQKEE